MFCIFLTECDPSVTFRAHEFKGPSILSTAAADRGNSTEHVDVGKHFSATKGKSYEGNFHFPFSLKYFS